MAFQFKIQLLTFDAPPVWRRLLVPEKFTFYRFHLVIQKAFGWENAHLFQFSPKGWGSLPKIGLKIEEEDEEMQDCKKIKLSQVFNKPKQTFTYIYDFGDDWLHKIVLEKITEDTLEKAELLKGEGKCPPEDCGGFPGYENLKEALADPAHPEHRELKDWLGLSPRQKWDPTEFNLQEVQPAVRRV
jgi:hypothetical protein